MQIIPVLDIAGGIAVHAQGGDRSRYAPLESKLVPDQVGDPVALLRAFHATLGVHECYVADLDAIQGSRSPAHSAPRARRLSHRLLPVRSLVDAGTHRPEGALEVLSCGASEVVVGLETLHAFRDLESIADLVGAHHVWCSASTSGSGLRLFTQPCRMPAVPAPMR